MPITRQGRYLGSVSAAMRVTPVLRVSSCSVESSGVRMLPIAKPVIDLVRALATFFFLWLTAEPLLQKLDRIKTKYGLAE